MNIFYIEDEDLIGRCVVEGLQDNGHSVTWVKDRGDIPKDLTSFDFVLSDFNVPGGSFLDTQYQCREQGIPLLVASGNFMAEDIHKHYLAKPFKLDVLEEKINETKRIEKGYSSECENKLHS